MVPKEAVVEIVSTGAAQALPDLKCARAFLHAEDGNSNDILFGDIDGQNWRLEPGDNSREIAANNLKQIYVKGTSGNTLIVHYDV